MNATSASILIFLTVVVLAAPRRWALLGMVAGVLYLTQWTSVDIAGFNIFPMRFLEIAGFARVIAHREWSFSNLNNMDRLFLLFYSYITIIFLLRSDENHAYHIGLAVDATLCYFVFRGLIGSIDDFRWFLRSFIFLLIPYVVILYVEMHTNHNNFSLLGGDITTNMFRGGRIRCIGSFRHPSLLGSLGASFIPLYIGLSFSRRNRPHAIIGILLSLAVVGFSNSSGPLTFAAIGAVGWILWAFRERMHLVRLSILAGIIAIALVMNAPVWYLPTHFSLGGDAWHRSYLIEVTMRHLGEWWLWGMPTNQTYHWFATRLLVSDSADITNQFISFGLSAGLMAIVLFVFLLFHAFRSIGKVLGTARLAPGRPQEDEYALWGLGAMLAGHIANFFAITYFDQFYVIWFMQLALISNLAQEYPCEHELQVRNRGMDTGSQRMLSGNL